MHFQTRKKEDLLRSHSSGETSLLPLLSLLSMYALSWKSLPADINAARVLCIHHFSELVNLRENSAINSSSPVGNTEFAR